MGYGYVWILVLYFMSITAIAVSGGFFTGYGARGGLTGQQEKVDRGIAWATGIILWLVAFGALLLSLKDVPIPRPPWAHAMWVHAGEQILFLTYAAMLWVGWKSHRRNAMSS